MNNTRKPSLEHLEDRNLMSTIIINWVPTITSFKYGTKLGPAELNASVNSTGPQNPPVASLLYLDQNGNGVDLGTVLPAGQDTITAYYGPYATATQTFTVTETPAPASPSLTPASPQTTTIQTTVNGAPTLSVTALLSGGNQATGTLTFTLKITPQNQSLHSYTVTPALVNVQGDGFYSASYTVPAGLAGTYTWNASYGGDPNNKPVVSTFMGTEVVETPTVYGTLNGQPITQYWYYPSWMVRVAAIEYHVNLAQPVGYFGTNPAAPPAAIANNLGTWSALWQGPTYSTTPLTGPPLNATSPVSGATTTVAVPVRETQYVKVSTEVKKTDLVKVPYHIEQHGKLVTVSKLVKESVWVQTYKYVKETVWVTVSKSIQLFNPNG